MRRLLMAVAVAAWVALAPPEALAGYEVKVFPGDDGMTCISHGEPDNYRLACGYTHEKGITIQYLCRVTAGSPTVCQNRDGSFFRK
jgi:hypothetical protein